jgi:uncharacterized protein (TIGR02246 family)
VDDGQAVQRLLDIEAIKQLKARYFRAIDQRRWDEFAAVFARDARLVVPEGDMVVDGRDEIAAAVSGALVGARTVHHGHMPEIEITGPDTARGIWAMFDHVDFGGADGAPVGITGCGHYHEEYVREDGAWRIARLELSRLRVDPLAGGFPSAHEGARS